MKFRAVTLIGVAALITLMVAGAVQATILDFGLATSSGLDTIHNNDFPSFGSKVNSLTDPNGFGTYLQGNAFTPNVITDYMQLVSNFPSQGMATYDGFAAGRVIGISNTGNIAFFSLIAQTGYKVTLNSFDISVETGSDMTGFFVVSGHGGPGDVLANYSSEDINGKKTEFPGVTDTILSIIWNNENFGINNVNFDQTAVPLPSALWLMGSGLLGLAGFGRRFQRKT